ncbi:MAG: ABC transporter ATP-binding protein [Stygiobacter sp. RIFOXYC12_FULL_38_8]|nr:MAG: ABC transporter ATP-binding protein [Stygiobacter sp. GWC2_38_9]OGV06459.1 MAG: ABC transporter ATP-binding protein [Stygiobacter sp. RIFOXYB2_FULL_37_11]OGV10924.1 MAG: ABC transporter ATP-binding protein [Stygiobacter sp. RIFOXYA2_FULL_38_8]OGV14055.1 MAG: ABC transporter ATP-binding protein [Stygiobacter sp. RIFOXYC2_FULL_38_25]OGV29557.1 MAG: ABC transporter ATP-binding protein [Stygiobacter sp. RIFOXYC12_FULL_38_8]OGV82386.1 MAG: ABC transporter ATP-binding protein [Stygiobacter s
MGNVVEIKDLTHYYGKKLVYENLSFNIKEGSIFGLLGKNGTGKTTTINILNGFLRPKSGKCLMFGEDSYNLSPATKARVGFLIEGHIQYSNMNIIQIEKFYSAFYPKWKKEPYYELMSKLAVTQDQKLSKMSCGQRSQVALGLILAQDPDLLILDDYSMGLDAGYRRLFIDYLTEYAKAEKKTIFITSHIIQDLENFLDDCVILDYKSVLMTMPIKEFMSTFKQFKFETSVKDLKLEKDDVVKSYEIIKNKAVIFTFEQQPNVASYLNSKGIDFNDLHQVPMSLEDAFIGITGKY